MDRDTFFSDTNEHYVTEWMQGTCCTLRVRPRVALADKLCVSLLLQEREEAVSFSPVSGGSRFCECAYTLVTESPVSWFSSTEDRESEEKLYYDRRGASAVVRTESCFQHIPSFRTPDWAKGAAMYQIFVDRFRDGGLTDVVETNEHLYIGLPVQHIENWDEKPSVLDAGYFYGGDLADVREKPAYLKDLGVEVTYFNPLFISSSNHKYDTQDYDHIDPHLTTIAEDGGELLAPGAGDNLNATRYQKRNVNRKNLEVSDRFPAEFVAEAHHFGFRILLDGVFNHCGSFHKWLDREKIYAREGGYVSGAYLTPDSPYRKYFVSADDRPEVWPDNQSYDGWWNNDTLPKLNYEASLELAEYVLEIGEKWLKPSYQINGWRLDATVGLGHLPDHNHGFWQCFHSRVKVVREDALILVGHYGGPASWLDGKEQDSVMNYDGFTEPASWFLTGMEKHSNSRDTELRGNGAHFWDKMSLVMTKLPEPSLYTATNQLSNHDHSRLLTRTNDRVGRLAELGSVAAEGDVQLSVIRQAALMPFIRPDAPTMYYDDEVDICGFTDLDSRRSYPWGYENLELLEYHRYLSKLHRNSAAFCCGSPIPFLMGQDLACCGRVYGREQALIFVHTGAEEKLLRLSYWKLADSTPQGVRRVMLTHENGYNVGHVRYVLEDGMILVYAIQNPTGIYPGTVPS